MLGVEKQGELSEMKKKLEEMLIHSEKDCLPFTDAIRDMLAAISYSDKVLLASSLNALFNSLTSVAKDIICSELARSEAVRNAIKQYWVEVVNGSICEDFDELKNIFESFIDETIAMMVKTQKDIVSALEQKDHRVENAQQLEDGIRGMRKFRESILKEWPSSGKRPSPINKDAIAEARKAIAAGNKGLSKDQLVCGNDVSKNGNE